MAVGQQIIERAESLFDVVGVSRLPSGDPLMVLGLESTPQRDLDEFGRLSGRFQMYGFRKHARSRLRSLLTSL